MPIKFLSATVTQGSADAFATVAVPTGLSNVSLAYRIREIDFFWPVPVEVDADYTLQLVRRTPTALVGAGDRTLIYSFQRDIKITTSGLLSYERTQRLSFPKDFDLWIVEDPIYFSIDSTTTSASNSAAVRIYYEEIRVSELQKVQALSESLNA